MPRKYDEVVNCILKDSVVVVLHFKNILLQYEGNNINKEDGL